MQVAADEPTGDAKGVLATIDRFFARLEDVLNLLSAIAIFVLMLLGVSNIFLRKAGDIQLFLKENLFWPFEVIQTSPIFGYIDLVEISMASFAFLGAAYTQRLGAHIRMEILLGFLKGRALWVVEALGALVGMLIIAVLIVYGWDHFYRAYDLGDTTIDAEYPLWPSKLLVPFAFSFWFIRLTIQFFGALRMAANPNATPIGVVVMKDAAEQAREEIRETFGSANLSEDANQGASK